MSDLFEYVKGREARDEGMARVEENASDVWKRHMAIYLREVCATNVLFTSDDVFDLARKRGLEVQTHDRRAFGPIMMRAAKSGMAVKENCAPRNSNRASRHSAPLSVWRSLIVDRTNYEQELHSQD